MFKLSGFCFGCAIIVDLAGLRLGVGFIVWLRAGRLLVWYCCCRYFVCCGVMDTGSSVVLLSVLGMFWGVLRFKCWFVVS